jgi:hypothetical protein
MPYEINCADLLNRCLGQDWRGPQPNRDSRFIFDHEVCRLMRFDPKWLRFILDSLEWP